ncbi:hypothetical protein [Chengkuizengella marina]|uniref:Uncharacterized protein n=1 Tax=Chengkuizengella marina TaxID=2507566 RepID=A0A6N9Q252_9BACL|nr:hypothetical protein [Chengkuizengella marina]NBI28484.1 hypothetical protein [Chengkuizengella marina]
MKRKVLIFSTLLSSIIFITFLNQGIDKDSVQSKEQNIEISEIYGDFVMDATKKEEVVGNSENVFIAKVIKQVGTQPLNEHMPRTQFEVEVKRNIKGKLKDFIIINQSAGFMTDSEGNVTLVKFENQELLEPGKTYLFASLYDSNNNWHNPVPGYGEVLVSDDTKKQMIDEYKKAFKAQKTSKIMEKHKDKDFVNGYIDEE